MRGEGDRRRREERSSEPAPDYGGRVPPNAIDAEQSVLGGVLLDNQAINTALEVISAEDFYRPAHAAIFSAMMKLADRHEPIDIITLTQQLKADQKLEIVGGAEYVAHLATVVPNAANVAYYAKLVRATSIRRRVIHEASRMAEEAFEEEGNVADFLDEVEQRMLGIFDKRTHQSFVRVGDVVQESIKVVEKLYDQKDPVTGVPSGFGDLDRMTAGFQPSDLIILAARPSMGKTALALTIGQFVGVHRKLPVAVFSLEMSKEQLVLRMLCAEARVGSSKVRTGHLGERDFPRLVDAASKIADAPIFIDDTPGITVTELRAKARRLHREVGLSLVIVDYLQLMRSPAYSNSREQEISDISRSLKGLAKELRVPVIALSQLNRSVESRTDKRPMMSDLRESGAIEQDADIIMFIYRDEVYNPSTPDKGVAEILIAKQRTGPTGVVRLAFFAEFTRFDSLLLRDDYEEDANTAAAPSSPANNPFAALQDNEPF